MEENQIPGNNHARSDQLSQADFQTLLREKARQVVRLTAIFYRKSREKADQKVVAFCEKYIQVYPSACAGVDVR
jgi:hypothetical protein